MSSGIVADHPVVEAAACAATMMHAACAGEVWRLSDDQVEDTLAALRRVASGTAALRAALLREADTRAMRERTGAPTLQKWLTDRFATSRATANAWTRDAATLGRHPLLADALAAGALSGEQASAVGEALDRLHALDGVSAPEVAAATSLLLEHAPNLTPAQVRAGGQALLETLTRVPDRDDPAEAEALAREADRAEAAAQRGERNSLRIRRGGPGGRLRGWFELGPLGEATLLAWLTRADKPVPGSDGADDDRDRDERRGDALVELLHAALLGAVHSSDEDADDADDVDDVDDGSEGDAEGAEDADVGAPEMQPGLFDAAPAVAGRDGRQSPKRTCPGRPRPINPTGLLMISVTLDELRRGLTGAGLTETGATLSAATLRRLACDARIVPAVLGSPSQVLDLGRAERLFSTAQKRAIILRDRGCVIPGCDRPPRACEAHHGWHWLDGGPTDLDNGFLLCEFHHRMVHRRGWVVELAPNGYPHVVPPVCIDPQRRPRQHLRYHIGRLRT